MHHQYAIYGGEFVNEEDAIDFLNNLRSSLLWYSLIRNFGLRYPQTNSSVQLFDNEIPVSDNNTMHKIFTDNGWEVTHGSYDADKAYVVPQHLCLSRFETGHATIRMGLSSNQLQDTLEESFAFPQLTNLQDHPKLRLGIEIYASSSFEISVEAKFLTLIASLEATLESCKISEASKIAVVRAKVEIKAQLDQSIDSEKEELELLLQRVNGLVERSIGDKFRRQIADRGAGLLDTDNLPKALSSAYSIRSRLIHDGRVNQNDLQSHSNFIQQFVPAYFEREFRRVTGAL